MIKCATSTDLKLDIYTFAVAYNHENNTIITSYILLSVAARIQF